MTEIGGMPDLDPRIATRLAKVIPEEERLKLAGQISASIHQKEKDLPVARMIGQAGGYMGTHSAALILGILGVHQIAELPGDPSNIVEAALGLVWKGTVVALGLGGVTLGKGMLHELSVSAAKKTGWKIEKAINFIASHNRREDILEWMEAEGIEK